MKELEVARQKLAALEKEVAAQQHKELAGLPAKYGFDSVKAFVKAVKAAANGRPVAKSSSGTIVSKSGKVRKARVPITDEIRTEVKKLVEAGKTGSEIAKAVGISLPSVQNVKKALGLVRK